MIKFKYPDGDRYLKEMHGDKYEEKANIGT